MQEEEKPEINAIEKQGKILADVMGRVVAPLVGLIAAGPIGAIAGGVTGVVLKYVIEDFFGKFLTPKEVKRVGTSAEYIISNINEKLDEGREINDIIFQKRDGLHSDAEELFEGILLKSKNEYQEKKLKYISNIFVNAVFDKTLSIDNINQILNITNQLTYRQICIISLIGKNFTNEFELRTEENRGNFNEIATEELVFLLDEARNLHKIGIMRSKDRMGINNYTDPAPAGFCLTRLGFRIFQFMGLAEMPNEEYTFINALK